MQNTDKQPFVPEPPAPITLEQFFLGCIIAGMVARGATEFDKPEIDNYWMTATALAQYTKEIEN